MVSTSGVSGIATWTNSVRLKPNLRRDDGGSEKYTGESQATANLQ